MKSPHGPQGQTDRQTDPPGKRGGEGVRLLQGSLEHLPGRVPTTTYIKFA